MSKKILIPSGNHMASNQFVYHAFHGGNYSRRFKFDNSCRYSLGGDNQLDWNKLGGIGFGFRPLGLQLQAHHNSARFGWRYNPITDKIEIAPYLYDNGERKYAETLGITPASFAIGDWFRVEIIARNSTVKYQAGQEIWNINQNIPARSGYVYPAFFGGNLPAPQRMQIEMD